MATRQSTIDFISDQLVELQGVRFRKMFGEYALYFEEKVVALICDDQVFVKITRDGTALVGDRYKEGYPYPGARPAMVVDAEELENSERLGELIRVTAAALPSPVPRRPKQKKPRHGEAAATTAAKRAGTKSAARSTTAAKRAGAKSAPTIPLENSTKAQRAAEANVKTAAKAQRAAKVTPKQR